MILISGNRIYNMSHIAKIYLCDTEIIANLSIIEFENDRGSYCEEVIVKYHTREYAEYCYDMLCDAFRTEKTVFEFADSNIDACN